MDEGARRWLLKTARQNHWRVAAWIELDDLIQDGFLHYARVRNKYKDVKDPPHIMALFKRTYINHLNVLAEHKHRSLEVLGDDIGPHVFSSAIGDFPLSVTSPPPPPIAALLRALSTDEGKARLRNPYRRRRTHRETLNERLCRIAGIENPFDLSGLLHEYLAP